jgi:hypothetical protein
MVAGESVIPPRACALKLKGRQTAPLADPGVKIQPIPLVLVIPLDNFFTVHECNNLHDSAIDDPTVRTNATKTADAYLKLFSLVLSLFRGLLNYRRHFLGMRLVDRMACSGDLGYMAMGPLVVPFLEIGIDNLVR